MNEGSSLTGFLCLGSVCLMPVITFVIGLLVGGNHLPFRVRIERNAIKPYYEVDADGTDYRQS